eukprot:Colp12_sorted_trinity150504_noHs@14285
MGKRSREEVEAEEGSAKKVKTEKKKKTEETDVEDTPMKGSSDKPEISYEELVKRCSVIASPLASKKLTKKIFKTVKKAAKSKQIKRGIKEVVKAIRKGDKGVVVIAGDISPIDVIAHLPVMCEDSQVPYVYVPSKEELGSASSTKRPTSVVLLKKHDDYKDSYVEVLDEVKALPNPYV